MSYTTSDEGIGMVAGPYMNDWEDDLYTTHKEKTFKMMGEIDHVAEYVVDDSDSANNETFTDTVEAVTPSSEPKANTKTKLMCPMSPVLSYEIDESPPEVCIQRSIKTRLSASVLLDEFKLDSASATPESIVKTPKGKTKLSLGPLRQEMVDPGTEGLAGMVATKLSMRGQSTDSALGEENQTDSNAYTASDRNTDPSGDSDAMGATLSAFVHSVERSRSRKKLSVSVDLSEALGIEKTCEKSEEDDLYVYTYTKHEPARLEAMGFKELQDHFLYLQSTLNVINLDLKRVLSENDSYFDERENLEEKMVDKLGEINEKHEVAAYELQKRLVICGSAPVDATKSRRKRWFGRS